MARHFEVVAGAARGDARAVILVVRRGRNPDAGFLNLLRDLHADLGSRGVTLLLCGVQPELLDGLLATGLVESIGADRIFTNGPPEQPCGAEAVTFALKLCDDAPPTAEPARGGLTPLR
jgi:hypothetical protein